MAPKGFAAKVFVTLALAALVAAQAAPAPGASPETGSSDGGETGRPAGIEAGESAGVKAGESAGVKAGPSERPWRVVYFEAGPFRDYVMNLVGMAMGLEDLGLIERGLVPVPQGDGAEGTWKWLAKNAGGDRLNFLADGFYSAGWDNSKLAGIGREILARIKAGEIDLVLAMGTPSSQIMATDAHRTPVLSITTTDPVSAGISKTPESSGLDHVHVQVEAGKIERQLSMFHNAIGFKTLGVPYDTSPEGQATMGVPTIEAVAAKKGFVIVPCYADLELPDPEASHRNLMACLNRLAQESEAVYLTVSNGMIEERMGEILAPLVANRRPTFSQKGPSETRMGVLMSLAEDDFQSSGRFEAEVIAALLAGDRPGQISQIFLPPLTMALNFKTAMDIGWNPPFETLTTVDELYVDTDPAPKPGAALGEGHY